MECRSFELTLVSAKGLKLDLENKKKEKKESIYAVAYISGGDISPIKFKTRSDKTGGSDPMWNSSPMKFKFSERIAQGNRLTLVVKIKAKRFFFDKKVGEIRVPVKGLLVGATAQGKPVQSTSYPVSGKYGNNEGVVNVTYKVGEIYVQKVVEPVAYSGGGRGSGTTSSSSGFGTGLIGGLMVADIASHAHAGGGCGGGGGGCGGGGGGCGGGGCGGGGCGGC